MGFKEGFAYAYNNLDELVADEQNELKRNIIYQCFV